MTLALEIAAAVCGDATYRVTVCFPGTPQNATCTYSIQSGASFGSTFEEEDPLQFQQQECPMGLLFARPCTQLTGSMTIAFGPCTQNDIPAPQQANNTLDVAAWMDIMGLRKVEVRSQTNSHKRASPLPPPCARTAGADWPPLPSSLHPYPHLSSRLPSSFTGKGRSTCLQVLHVRGDKCKRHMRRDAG